MTAESKYTIYFRRENYEKVTDKSAACLPAGSDRGFACGCSNTPDPSASNWKVTFYEGDGTTVLQEVEVADGEPVAMPELTKEGYIIEGYYATPALKVEFDVTQPITEDTAIL